LLCDLSADGCAGMGARPAYLPGHYDEDGTATTGRKHQLPQEV